VSDYIDLNFQQTPRTIATAILQGPDGVTLIDPGPTSCLDMLEHGLTEQGMTLADVRTLLLTHIHLDHAGAAGSIVARVPGVLVYVHEVGAPHLADPEKLLASATRLYGGRMQTLWGAFLPVPADRLRPLRGGETIRSNGSIRVAYTPGHAKHHVSYLDEASGVAYVGDTGGVCVSRDYLLAPTPPPEIDIESWQQSLDVIGAWNPDVLFLTHFGPTGPAHERLRQMRKRLQDVAELARVSFTKAGSDEARMQWFVEELRRDARRALPELDARALETAVPFEQIWLGLARYWRKKGDASSA
jgi:glyoxylase-like metal-dependent hydrolase (beta-lactamase superfamily II)